MTFSPELARAWSSFDAVFLPDHPSDEGKAAEIARLRARWRTLHYQTFSARADETKRLYGEMEAIEADLRSVRLDAIEELEACAAEMIRGQRECA